MSERAASEPLFLQPGELIRTVGPARVRTVLGSCVAITVRVPRLRRAAIAHCLLPEAGVPAETLPDKELLRYVDTTLERMLREFADRGAGPQDLEVKLFGGADRIGGGIGGRFRVGTRNIETALKILEGRGISVAASGVGGRRGRVIEFDTESGEVVVRILPDAGTIFGVAP